MLIHWNLAYCVFIKLVYLIGFEPIFPDSQSDELTSYSIDSVYRLKGFCIIQITINR